MIGTYRFYQQGSLIGVAHNLITTEGSKAILRFLADGGRNLASSIAVGIGATTPTVADRRLTYEVERATVTVTSPDLTAQRIVFKGTLPQSLTAKIYEVGAFTTEFPMGSRSLVNFEGATETWTGGAFTATNARSGVEGLTLTPAASATATARITNLGLDLSSFSTNDEFLLAYNYGANAATIRIRFYAEDGTSYYEYSFTPTTGYNVKSFTKSNMTKVGTVDYGAISFIEFAVTATAGGAANILFDGLKVEDKDFVDPRVVMISHALVPSAPIVKTNVSPMDIEYSLDMNIT